MLIHALMQLHRYKAQLELCVVITGSVFTLSLLNSSNVLFKNKHPIITLAQNHQKGTR